MLSLVAMLLIAVLISGCGGSKSGGNSQGGTPGADAESSGQADNTSSPNDEQVVITYMRHSYDVEVNAMKKLIASFEEKHPNIKVNMQVTPGDYDTKIRTMLAGGEAPDIMSLDGPNLAAFAQQGVLLPLDDYMKADGEIEDISKPVLDSLTYEGKIYAAPLNDSSVAMFYNKKMFEEKGIPLPSKNPDEAWTWDQVLDAAKQLNDPEKGIVGWDPGYGFPSGEAMAFFKMPWLWQAGAEVLSPDGKTAKGYLDSPKAKEAIAKFASLYTTEKVASVELPPEAFETGKVAIKMDGPWAISGMQSAHPEFKLGEDYDIAPLWKQDRQASPNGSWNMAIWSKSKHPKEAWMFINWVTGVEGAKVWYEETHNLPARKSTAQAIAELNEYPMNIFMQQSIKYAHARPVTPAYPTLTYEVGKLFENVVLAGLSVDDATSAAVEKIDAAIQRTQMK
ncbi:ABC transporter substrate-binding protein [Paenibacillaceae bacterium WGS1546]|uniref:ABC transporter substrate-binding protein n=1 Tax=Cohnella sp. WGS1546 TaxID=3366810 RepID=UPI00372CEE7A